MKREWLTGGIALLSFAHVSIFSTTLALADSFEKVEGHACYAYGDDETPALAKKKAMARAREQAVSGYQVFVQSSSKVKDFQLQEDLIHTMSAGMLHHVRVEKEEKEGQEICITISAGIEAQSVEKEIDRRLEQRAIKAELTSTPLTPDSDIKLKVWVEKTDGQYSEGENLVVYVKSEEDAYLKLDYFQADGSVVHMVPNLFRRQAFIQKGQTYEFGGKNSPEQFVISGPFGDETIKALASTSPFGGGIQMNQPMSESQSYINTLKKGLEAGKRGVRVISGASTTLYTTSQEVLEHKKAVKEREE